MHKLKDNIDQSYIYFISEWWGLADKPGTMGMFIFPDASYVRKKIYFQTKMTNEEEVTQVEGKISEQDFSSLEDFFKEKVTQNSTQMIFDYGCTLEKKDGDNTIKVENNTELFKEAIKLVPFRE